MMDFPLVIGSFEVLQQSRNNWFLLDLPAFAIDNDVKILGEAIWLSKILGSSPIDSSRKQRRLHVSKYSASFNRKLLIHRALIFILLFGGIIRINVHLESGWTNQILFGLALLILSTVNVYLVSIKNNATSICVYINSIMHNSNCLKETRAVAFDTNGFQNSLKLQLNLFLAYNLQLTAVILPVCFVYGLHWNNPCKPSLVGYFLMPTCALESLPSGSFFLRVFLQGLKILMLIINHWTWAYAYNAVPLVGSIIVIRCGMLFQRHIIR